VQVEFLLNLHTGRSLTENTIPDAVLIQFDLQMMSTMLLETCEKNRIIIINVLYNVVVQNEFGYPYAVIGIKVDTCIFLV